MPFLIKIVKYVLLLTAIGYWAISFSSGANNWAIKNKIFPNDYRFGDLYRLSNLPQFKQKIYPCLESKIYNKSSKNTPNLYIIGDSFTHPRILNKANFDVQKYTRMHWDSIQIEQLDTSTTNILLIEIVEKNILYYFGNEKIEAAQIIEKRGTKKMEPQKSKLRNYFENLLARFEYNCKGMEERIWQTTFSYDAILYLKEIKATLNLKLFDRVADNIYLDDDGTAIYYIQEADPNKVGSSTYKIENSVIDKIVVNLNNSAIEYKNMGFDEVYYTFIPNKASITNYRKAAYNHLLERIFANNNFKVKHFDVFQEFKKSPEKYYYKSDTHWNCMGLEYWTSLVNKELHMQKNVKNTSNTSRP